MVKLALGLMLGASCAFSQWNPGGVPIFDTSASRSTLVPYMVRDGAGGCYIGWDDRRNGTDRNVFLQHLDGRGIPLWTHNGIPVVTAPYQQLRNQIAPDGRGGVFVTWVDDRDMVDSYIYAQRIDGAGRTLWVDNGVKAAEKSGLGCAASPDGRGGVVLLWTKTYSVVAQRLDSLGSRMWGDSGVGLDVGGAVVWYHDVIGDGQGGALATWIQGDSVYLVHIRADGSLDWGEDPRAIGHGTLGGGAVNLIGDGAGGAIVVWTVLEPTMAVYAQRVDTGGTALWGTTAVYVGTGGMGSSGGLVSDGRGGAIIRVTLDLHALRSDGSSKWATDARIDTDIEDFWLVPDGSSGACVVYTKVGYSKLLAQRVDSSGFLLWDSTGVRICNVGGVQIRPVAVSDDSGGIIAVWEDKRAYPTIAIYAGKVDAAGSVVTEVSPDDPLYSPDALDGLESFPNPFYRSTEIRFKVAGRASVKVGIFDILGRQVRVLREDELQGGEHTVTWDGRAENGAHLSSGIYYCRVQTEDKVRVVKIVLIHR